MGGGGSERNRHRLNAVPEAAGKLAGSPTGFIGGLREGSRLGSYGCVQGRRAGAKGEESGPGGLWGGCQGRLGPIGDFILVCAG